MLKQFLGCCNRALKGRGFSRADRRYPSSAFSVESQDMLYGLSRHILYG